MYGFLGVRGEAQDVLVGEEGGAGADQGVVEGAGESQPAAVGAGEGAQRQAGGVFGEDVEAAGADQPAQRRSTVKNRRCVSSRMPRRS
jgi:hypothetical protein